MAKKVQDSNRNWREVTFELTIKGRITPHTPLHHAREIKSEDLPDDFDWKGNNGKYGLINNRLVVLNFYVWSFRSLQGPEWVGYALLQDAPAPRTKPLKTEIEADKFFSSFCKEMNWRNLFYEWERRGSVNWRKRLLERLNSYEWLNHDCDACQQRFTCYTEQ